MLNLGKIDTEKVYTFNKAKEIDVDVYNATVAKAKREINERRTVNWERLRNNPITI